MSRPDLGTRANQKADRPSPPALFALALARCPSPGPPVPSLPAASVLHRRLSPTHAPDLAPAICTSSSPPTRLAREWPRPPLPSAAAAPTVPTARNDRRGRVHLALAPALPAPNARREAVLLRRSRRHSPASLSATGTPLSPRPALRTPADDVGECAHCNSLRKHVHPARTERPRPGRTTERVVPLPLRRSFTRCA